MAVNLGIELCGIQFANPFLLASAPPTRAKRWPHIARAGWAGGVTWSGDCLRPGNLVCRYYSPDMQANGGGTWTTQLLGAYSQAFIDGAEEFSLELLGERIHEAKKVGLPLGANIMLGADSRPWVEAAKVAEKAGADFLELNLSCPKWPLGLHFCRDGAIVHEIVSNVRRATRLPIIAKLHAILIPEDLRTLAIRVVNAGADAISCTNSLHGMVGIDINTGLPWAYDVDHQGRISGTSSFFFGPMTKPIGLRAVAEISSVVDVPIIGLGGISDWRDAVEYMMAGASVVQVGMAAMIFGYHMVQDLKKGMEGFMKEKGYSSTQDFIGLSRKKVSGFGAPQAPYAMSVSRRMIVDEEKCDGCGRCVTACLAAADSAIQLRRKVARIDHDLCQRCNLCRLVCPQNAISTTGDGDPCLDEGRVGQPDVVRI